MTSAICCISCFPDATTQSDWTSDDLRMTMFRNSTHCRVEILPATTPSCQGIRSEERCSEEQIPGSGISPDAMHIPRTVAHVEHIRLPEM